MKKILLAFLLILLPSLCCAGSYTPSSLTAQGFITRVRADLNAPSGKDTFYSDTEFIQWVSEAAEMIAALTGGIETSETIDLVEGQMGYPISVSHYDVGHVIYDSGVTGSPTRYNFVVRFIPGLPIGTQEPRPKVWWEWQDKIYVLPVPDGDIAGTQLFLYLIGKHAQVTAASDSITTPAYMDPAIVYYLKAKAYFKERSEEKGTYYMKLFNSLVNEHKRSIIRRDTAPMVEPAKEER